MEKNYLPDGGISVLRLLFPFVFCLSTSTSPHLIFTLSAFPVFHFTIRFSLFSEVLQFITFKKSFIDIIFFEAFSFIRVL